MPFRRILLADDDRALAALVSTALREEGFEVEHVTTGLQAVQSFERAPPDAIVLDVLMPEMDGLEVCRKIRRRSRVPIILLTSRGEEVDRVTGLETGADDYVTKPFSLRELCARIRALERRASGPAPEEGGGEAISAGALTIDPDRFEVRWKGVQASLTRSELQVLSALVRRRGRVLSREQLLELARGDDAVVTDRTVDTFIKRIRKKLRDAEPSFDEIETVIGVGYRYR
ncbi:MAG TPA: response regulator transcription factor [Myxococcaceae bacterium]